MKVQTNDDVINQFIGWRTKLKISQRELSRLSGVPQKTISRIENGLDSPTLGMMFKLLRPMNLTLKIIENGDEV
jgi:transcriptional regulator with XRE-family HTH domain